MPRPSTAAPAASDAGRPRLHVVALAHLDTQWRWTERDTAALFLPATVSENEALFERHPAYVLSFEGAHRYHLLEQLHPELFARLLARVAAGRWHPAGAAIEAFDAILPSPESLLRQIHLGQRWFASRFGVESVDLFLPDCFGFPASLPQIAAHAGLLGFVTQKLRRGELLRAARPIPFPYGRWRGADGSEILAALDPGEYSARITGDLSRDPAWLARFAARRTAGHPERLLTFVGIGDRGGAPPEPSIAALAASLVSDGPIEVRHGGSDRIHVETTEAERARLPACEGDLLLRQHGTGCYSAKLALKRWNRANERRARAAEGLAALAARCGRPAPRDRLAAAWWRFLARQMHDDLTGTAIPAAYRISLADEALAASEFDEVAGDSLAHLARVLGRPAAGTPVILFNPLGQTRRELVEIAWPEAGLRPLHVVGPRGELLPTQVGGRSPTTPTLLFVAELAPLSAAVFTVCEGPNPAPPAAPAAASPRGLDNGRLRARFDEAGLLASLVDAALGRELLAAPSRPESFANRSRKYPAWEILWSDLAAGPRASGGTLRGERILESGPLRATLELERELDGQRLRERWSLAAGDAGDRLECELRLDARQTGRLLKYTHHFAVDAPQIACDLGLGLVRRPLASEALYEVPAQRFAALEDGAGGGAAVLADVLAGWDHPDPSTLRLTCLHAPRASFKWRHQRTQDRGRHLLRFALAGLAGRADDGAAAALADRFAEPPLAWRGDPGPAVSGPASLGLGLACDAARVVAFKPGDDTDESILRLANPTPERVTVTIGDPGLRAARRLDGREREVAPLTVPPGRTLQFDLPPHALVTVGLDLAPAEARAEPVPARPVPLPCNRRAFRPRGRGRLAGGFDGRHFLPAELLPARLESTSVPFDLGHVAAGGADTLVCRGQLLDLPEGCAELWLLGAAVGRRELEFEFGLDERTLRLTVPGWRAPLYRESRFRPRLLGEGVVEEAFTAAATAWIADFVRDRDGRELPGERALLAQLCLPVAGARRLSLPAGGQLRLVAASAVPWPARPGRLVSLARL